MEWIWQSQDLRALWFGFLTRTLYRRLIFFERWIDDPVPEYVPSIEADIRRLDVGHESEFRALRPHGVSTFQQRLAQGHQCWGAWCENRLSHITWIGVGEVWIDYLGRSLPLADWEIYTYGGFTHQDWRGRGLWLARDSLCLRILRRQGYRRALSAVEPENRLGLQVMRDGGYRRIGVMGYIGRGHGRRFFYRADPGARPPEGLRSGLSTRRY
jgi:hypothetical protein